jgi:hypothetical protein
MSSTTNHNALILEVVYEAFKNGFCIYVIRSQIHGELDLFLHAYGIDKVFVDVLRFSFEEVFLKKCYI